MLFRVFFPVKTELKMKEFYFLKNQVSFCTRVDEMDLFKPCLIIDIDSKSSLVE